MSRLIKGHHVASTAVLAPLPQWPGRVVRRQQVELAAPAVVAPAFVPEPAGSAHDAVDEDRPAAAPVAEPDLREAARAEANRIIAAAQSRAELIIDEALAGADKLAAEARAAGYEEGRAAGLAAAEEEIAQLRQQLEEERARLAAEREEGLAELERLRAEAEMAAHRLRHEAAESAEQLVADSQQQIVELALAVAGRILQREIERDPEALIGVLVGALQRVRGAGTVTVKVAPSGVAVLAQADEVIDRTELGIDTLTVVADPALGPGDVVVETEHGLVDARIDEQLDAMRRSLGEVLGHDNT